MRNSAFMCGGRGTLVNTQEAGSRAVVCQYFDSYISYNIPSRNVK